MRHFVKVYNKQEVKSKEYVYTALISEQQIDLLNKDIIRLIVVILPLLCDLQTYTQPNRRGC
jgi:hypothetical protein